MSRIRPPSGELHLQSVWLRSTPATFEMCRGVLSPPELARADKFLRDEPRVAFVLSQAALRLLLADYLDCEASEVPISPKPGGKPLLDCIPRLHFSKSHSGSVSIFAFCADVEVGADLEEIRMVPNLNKIAARFFCPGEVEELASITDPAIRDLSFLRAWTRKEALLKCTGTGIANGLHRFRVTLKDQDPPAVLEVAEAPHAAQEWSLHSFQPTPDYIAAVAYQRTSPLTVIDLGWIEMGERVGFKPRTRQ